MLRAYRSTDLEDVLATWAAASALAHPFLSEAFQAAERELIATTYLPAAETWVWQDGERVVGFISLLGHEIGGLFVHPSFQGRGIGSALVDEARRRHGDLEVEVFADNALGRAFYDGRGFRHLADGVHEDTGLPILRLRLPAAGPDRGAALP